MNFKLTVLGCLAQQSSECDGIFNNKTICNDSAMVITFMACVKSLPMCYFKAVNNV